MNFNLEVEKSETLMILQGLETLYDQLQEYREVVYDDMKDFLLDINTIRRLYNKLLIQAQNEGVIDNEASLIQK